MSKILSPMDEQEMWTRKDGMDRVGTEQVNRDQHDDVITASFYTHFPLLYRRN